MRIRDKNNSNQDNGLGPDAAELQRPPKQLYEWQKDPRNHNTEPRISCGIMCEIESSQLNEEQEQSSDE